MHFITLADGVSVNLAQVSLITPGSGPNKMLRLTVVGDGEVQVTHPKDIATIENMLKKQERLV